MEPRILSPSTVQTALICALAMVLAAVPVAGAESAAGILYTNGPTSLNGTAVPRSAPIFAGDVVQTRADSMANITSVGSSVVVLTDSRLKFQGPAAELESGGARVNTSKGLSMQAGEVVVKPAKAGWTEYVVKHVDGEVQIAANKGDLTIQDSDGTTTLSQGQQASRDDSAERKKKKRRRGGVAPAASGGVLSSPGAIYTGAAVVGGVTTWVLLQHEDPVSPDCRVLNCKP